MAEIEWPRARWAVLYILRVHGDMYFDDIVKIARDRFDLKLSDYMMRRFRRQGILEWPFYARYCSITDKGRSELSISD